MSAIRYFVGDDCICSTSAQDHMLPHDGATVYFEGVGFERLTEYVVQEITYCVRASKMGVTGMVGHRQTIDVLLVKVEMEVRNG